MHATDGDAVSMRKMIGIADSGVIDAHSIAATCIGNVEAIGPLVDFGV